MNEEEEHEERDEWLLDEVTGTKRKAALSTLNKKKVTRYELDELFASDEA